MGPNALVIVFPSGRGGGGGGARAVGGGIGHFEADLYLCGGTNGRPLIYYFPDPRKYATPIVVGTSLENNTPHVREYKGFEIQVYSSPLLSAPPPPALGEVNDKYIILAENLKCGKHGVN